MNENQLKNLCIHFLNSPLLTVTMYNIEGNTNEIGGTVIVLTKLKSQSIDRFEIENIVMVINTTVNK